MGRMQQRFKAAFESALEHPLDRKVLVALLRHAKEARYMELHRAVGQPHKQEYRDTIQRLMDHALLKRRLVSKGEGSERYETHLSLSGRGLIVARFFGESQSIGDMPPDYREAMRDVLLGEVERASPADAAREAYA